jgi:uncharacterized membrane protein HdeD (DUF308 family)
MKKPTSVVDDVIDKKDDWAHTYLRLVAGVFLLLTALVVFLTPLWFLGIGILLVGFFVILMPRFLPKREPDDETSEDSGKVL